MFRWFVMQQLFKSICCYKKVSQNRYEESARSKILRIAYKFYNYVFSLSIFCWKIHYHIFSYTPVFIEAHLRFKQHHTQLVAIKQWAESVIINIRAQNINKKHMCIVTMKYHRNTKVAFKKRTINKKSARGTHRTEMNNTTNIQTTGDTKLML